jgi:hypothetical protein
MMAAEDTSPSPVTHRSARQYPGQLLAPLTAYLAFAVICYWHIWTSSITQVSFPNGDQYTNIWFLNWVPYAILHGHNPFFSSFINYPHGANLLTNTGEPLLGLLASPITLIWGPIASFNVLLTLSLALSAMAGYVFVRQWVKWGPAAFLGGLLYGFSPYEILHGAGQLNLCFIPLPPLVLLCLFKVVVERRWTPSRGGLILGVLISAQFFVSTELLADTMVVALLALVCVAMAGHKVLRPSLAATWPSLCIAGGTAAILLAYPTWFALFGPQSISGPIQAVAQGYRADLLGPIVPDRFQAFVPTLLSHLSRGLGSGAIPNESYLGPTLLALLVVTTVVWWRRVEVRIFAILGASAFIVSLGDRLVVSSAPGSPPAGHLLPGWLVFHVPFLTNAIPARFALFVVLCAAVLLSIAVEELRSVAAPHSRSSLLWGSLCALGVGVVALLPVVPNVPFDHVANISAPPFFTNGIADEVPANTAALLYPYPDNGDARPMVWQAQSTMSFKMPGGDLLVPVGPSRHKSYSAILGNAPTSVTGLTFSSLASGVRVPPVPKVKRAILQEVRGWGISEVIATPSAGRHPAAALSYLEGLFGRPEVVRAGTYLWRTK